MALLRSAIPSLEFLSRAYKTIAVSLDLRTSQLSALYLPVFHTYTTTPSVKRTVQIRMHIRTTLATAHNTAAAIQHPNIHTPRSPQKIKYQAPRSPPKHREDNSSLSHAPARAYCVRKSNRGDPDLWVSRKRAPVTFQSEAGSIGERAPSAPKVPGE